MASAFSRGETASFHDPATPASMAAFPSGTRSSGLTCCSEMTVFSTGLRVLGRPRPPTLWGGWGGAPPFLPYAVRYRCYVFIFPGEAPGCKADRARRTAAGTYLLATGI
ncbi:MAG: hypothetical protein JWO38_3419 [Gemmataceae bacterium]|nr:hypothetical protein [Gemmataceae bacterium]